MKLFNKLFFEHGWVCFYRRKKSSVLSNSYSYSYSNNQQFKQLITDNRYWCADPFIVREREKYYVFCELMDTKTSHGLIGVAELNPYGKTYVRPIIDLKCHASYPNLFKVQDTWYMIPETSERKTIELYQAVFFPDKWERKSILAENIMSVDTTVFLQDGQHYVFIYEPHHNPDKLSIAKLNVFDGILEDKILVKNYQSRVGRPAGNVWVEKEQYYRPVQSGIKKYGEKMLIYSFQFNKKNKTYIEKEEKILSLEDFDKSLSRYFFGCHTYNSCDDFEVVDTTYVRFSIFRPIRLLLKYFEIGGYKFGNKK